MESARHFIRRARECVNAARSIEDTARALGALTERDFLSDPGQKPPARYDSAIGELVREMHDDIATKRIGAAEFLYSAAAIIGAEKPKRAYKLCDVAENLVRDSSEGWHYSFEETT